MTSESVSTLERPSPLVRGDGDPGVVAVTGSTGTVGRPLVKRLRSEGFRVLRLSRSEREGSDWIRWDPEGGRLDSEALDGVDVVVHLAGEPIAGSRWTDAKKRAIRDSREKGTSLLSRTLAELNRRPSVLVSASAVGYYGDRGDEKLDEDSRPGRGFLAEVCKRWEAATHTARAVGIRTIHLRTGLVLAEEGGVLGQIELPFKLGLGGRVGSGRQYWSWIDIEDHIRLVLHAIRTPTVRGAVNATSPNPVTNAAFTDVLGRVLRRPTLIPLPTLAVRILLGEMGRELLLAGQRVTPRKALESGFEFLYPDLEDSLRERLNGNAE